MSVAACQLCACLRGLFCPLAHSLASRHSLTSRHSPAYRHSRVGGNLGQIQWRRMFLTFKTIHLNWIPAYAGMTGVL